MKSIPDYLGLLIIFMLLNIGNDICAQEASISRGAAGEKIECFYSDLGAYAKRAREYSGQYSNYERIKERVLDAVTKDCLITHDLLRFDGQKKLEEIKIESYLTNLNMIAGAGNRISFEVDCRNMTFDYNRDNNTYLACGVILKVTAFRNSYQCKATIGFKSGKIDRIKYSEFEDIENPTDIEHERAKENDLGLDLSTGFKFGKDAGLTFGFAFTGISENWFWSRWRIGSELFIPVKQYQYEHYPTAVEGFNSILSYIQKDNDWAIGFTMGYMVFPGKYYYRYDKTFDFFANFGIGSVFYDKWWEQTESDAWLNHNYTVGVYFFPSILTEIRFNNTLGHLGIDVGYYFSPQCQQLNGLRLSVTISSDL